MSKNLTWLKPSGEWGIEGVDLAALPPAAYGALVKLMRLEHPICEPNPPLTLEELREMDGEPVYCVSIANPKDTAWGIACMRAVNPYVLTYKAFFYLQSLESAWLAYRRKPEG